MDRREAITRVGLLFGGTVIGSSLFLQGCKSSGPSVGNIDDLFKPETVSFLNEVAETILPATKTPGAKEAKVGEFMGVMVRDCYTKDDQKVFLDGLGELDKASQKKNSKSFMESTPEQRTALLVDLDKEAKDYAAKQGDKNNKRNNKSPDKDKSAPNHYFTMIKQLTLLGFFTSEVGATKALRYVAVPGKYVGDYPYKKGDKAWATS